MAFDWETLLQGAGPSLIQGGMGMIGGNMAVKEADRRSAEARAAGEPYSASALNQLLQAQQFNTADNAKSRYEQQMALMKPGQENDQLKMMRMLQAKGLLGTSTNAPTTGLEAGTAHNPFVSSLLGAQETARQQAAARALDDSQNTLNQMVTRSSALQQNAGAAQNRMQSSQPTASKASMFGEMAKGLGGMLGNKDVMSAIFGAFKGGGAPQATAQQSANANGQWDQPGSYSAPSFSAPSFSMPSWADSGSDGYDVGGGFGNWYDSDRNSGYGYDY